MLIQLGLGFLIGLVMALTGAGGGILAVPLLVLVTGMSVSEAAPIGLLAVGVAALLGTVIGLRSGIVRYRAAMMMAVVGMLMAPVGIWLARATESHWLNGLFAMLLLYVAYRTFRRTGMETTGKDKSGLACIRSDDTGRFLWSRRCAQVLALSGGIAGLLSGLLGVGGGFVIVPALKRHTDLPTQSVIATSMAVITLVTTSGVISAALSRGVDWNLGSTFASGAVGGMFLGRRLSLRIADENLDLGFALLSAVIAFGMVIKTLA